MRVILFLLLFTGCLFAQDTVYFKKAPTDPKIYKGVRFDGEFYFLEAMSKEFWETKVKAEDIDRIVYFKPAKDPDYFDPRTNDSLRTEEYCLIVGTSQLFSTKVIISIDYGQEARGWGSRNITDSNGELMKFNSMIDALSYMNGFGWEFVSAYPMMSGQGTCYHFLMRRKYKR